MRHSLADLVLVRETKFPLFQKVSLFQFGVSCFFCFFFLDAVSSPEQIVGHLVD